MEIVDGKFVNHGAGKQRVLKESPFAQADSYKWAMINNQFLNKDEIFLTTMCAFPSATLERTNNDEALDLLLKWHREDPVSDKEIKRQEEFLNALKEFRRNL